MGVKVKIVSKEKKIENILSKLEAIENQVTTTVETQQGTSTQSPVPMTQDPTSISTKTTQNPITNQPTTDHQTTGQPTKSQPRTSQPATTRPISSEPTTYQPSQDGETPK